MPKMRINLIQNEQKQIAIKVLQQLITDIEADKYHVIEVEGYRQVLEKEAWERSHTPLRNLRFLLSLP